MRIKLLFECRFKPEGFDMHGSTWYGVKSNDCFINLDDQEEKGTTNNVTIDWSPSEKTRYDQKYKGSELNSSDVDKVNKIICALGQGIPQEKKDYLIQCEITNSETALQLKAD